MLIQVWDVHGQKFITNISIDTVFSGATSICPYIQHPEGQSNTHTTISFLGYNKRIKSFRINTTSYIKNWINQPSAVHTRRNGLGGVTCTPVLHAGKQASGTWNDRQLYFAERQNTSNNVIISGMPSNNTEQQIAQIIRNGYFNKGVDNLFNNRKSSSGCIESMDLANANANNVERIDVLWENGIRIVEEVRHKAGILVGNRGSFGDPVSFAAIKGLSGGAGSGNSTRYQYIPKLININSFWTVGTYQTPTSNTSFTLNKTGVYNMPTFVLRKFDLDGQLNGLNNNTTTSVSNFIGSQDIGMVFITFAEVGLQYGDIFYGYSIIPPDVNPSNNAFEADLSNYLSYPTNTDSEVGGVDLSSVSGVFFDSLSKISLPIKLAQFNAHALDNQVQLSWTTASEYNSLRFDIERSQNGINWETLNFVPSKNTQNIRIDYEYIDAAPLQGMNQYRLKQMDKDGAFAYSLIRSVWMQRNQQVIELFPNPANSTINISGGTDYQHTKVSIFNIQGKEQMSFIYNGNVQSIAIDQLKPGMYYIRFSNDRKTKTLKFTKA